MKEKEFKKLIIIWADDAKQVKRWFYSIATQKNCLNTILKTYEQVNTMWTKHKDVFPNKGNYKTVRRLFIKYLQRFFAHKCAIWEVLSPELCKEILHKADQGWISYQYEIPYKFCNYLKWKSVQAGYHYQGNKIPCYVDENLKAVYRQEDAAGIVKWHQDKHEVEAMFFSPLSYYKNSSRISALIGCHDWRNCYYPKYEVSFPTKEACSLFNLYAPQKVRNCHLKAIPANKELFAPEMPLVLIDDDVQPASCTTIAENLYVSVYLTLEQFKEINPNIGFPEIYLTD